MIERERAEKGGPEQIVRERKKATKDHSGAGCARGRAQRRGVREKLCFL